MTNQQSELITFIHKSINQMPCTIQPATLLTYCMTLLGWFGPLFSKNIWANYYYLKNKIKFHWSFLFCFPLVFRLNYSASDSNDRNRVKSRLKKFISRRPSLKTLQEKGLIKGVFSFILFGIKNKNWRINFPLSSSVKNICALDKYFLDMVLLLFLGKFRQLNCKEKKISIWFPVPLC